MPKIRIEGVRGNGLTSKAIAWFGGGMQFSHFRNLLPSGDYIDSRSDWTVDGTIPPGVQIRPKDYDTDIVYCVRFELRVSRAEETLFLDALHNQLGKPYDTLGIINFVTGSAADRNWREQSAWFCDDLSLWACEESGRPKIFLQPYRLTPNAAAVALTAWKFSNQKMPLPK